ncbi:hypothetical protein CL634_05405 [bacterium]|nr:hypothetical protein [bacterium]|tara:strand:- start:124 stop:408 length:285 start_codon:yes stop_codon:yes gene_type:complete
MEYQTLFNVAVGVVSLLGGWVFRMMLSQAASLRDEQRELAIKHAHDTEQMLEKYTNLALSLPEKYVSKDDFKTFSERMNDRFDRLEEKIDSLPR